MDRAKDKNSLGFDSDLFGFFSFYSSPSLLLIYPRTIDGSIDTARAREKINSIHLLLLFFFSLKGVNIRETHLGFGFGKMNLPVSECSSGCESGWTHYLDRSSSSFSPNQCQRRANVDDEYYGRKGSKEDENEEEEDLSMVSDASSGPPHFQEDEDEDENGYFCSASESAKKSEKKKKIKKNGCKQQQSSYLDDDTASSPVLSFSKKNVPLSNNHQVSQGGFPATHFKGKSAFQKHLGFFKSSIHGKSSSKEPGGF